MRKKIVWTLLFSFALCCTLLLGAAGRLPSKAPGGGLFALTADAAEIVDSGACGANGNNLTWTLDSDGLLTISGIGAMENYSYSSSSSSPWYSYRSSVKTVAIESGVTSIGRCAFYNCSGLTSVTIPDSVTSIGGSVFGECKNLMSMTLPFIGASLNADGTLGSNKLGHLFSKVYEYDPNFDDMNGYDLQFLYTPDDGDGAYYACIPRSLNRIVILDGTINIPSGAFSSCESLISVTIPGSVTSIGSFAFENCISLTSVTIPDSVTTFGKGAFSKSGLTAVTIPDSVTSIGDSAFYGCSGLTTVTIPDSVTSIGYNAFDYCNHLTDVYISDFAAWCDISFGNSSSNPLSFAHHLYVGGAELTELVIPDGVTGIGNFAFYGFSGLTSVTIPDSVTSIGYDAFYKCTWLTTIKIPDSVTSIGDYAFYKCTGLTTIMIPDSVTSVGDYAFSETAWYDAQPDGLVYAGMVACKYKGEMPANTNLVIADGTKRIAGGALRSCSGLISVTIPDSVISIGGSAFYGCAGLTSVTIPDSVTSIGDRAFYGCTGLTSVTIPDSVTSIGDRAFSGCNHLTDVYISDLAAWCDISFDNSSANPLSSAHHLHVDDAVLTEFMIPDGVTSIGNFAFYGFSGLTSVTIPDSVTSIGDSAFYGCSGLTSVTIPDSVTSIGDSAFYNCNHLTTVYISDLAAWCGISFSNSSANPLSNAHHLYVGSAELTGLVIPDSVTGIGRYAFSGCSGLTSVTIPDSVTSIGESAFAECKNLASITLPFIGTSLKAGDYNGEDKLGFIFSRHYGYFDPDDETDLEEYDYQYLYSHGEGSDCYGCIPKSLKSIIILDGTVKIPSAAFWNCESLTSVTIPSSVTSIGNNAVPSTATIYGYAGSYAEQWANENGITFVALLPSGECGENVTWTLDGDGLLTISGTGAMADYTDASAVPWYSYSDSIKDVAIGPGVTGIGSYAFSGCTGLTSVTIPDGVTTVGKGAFSKSGLTSVTIGSGVEALPEDAFYKCTALTAVTLPEGLRRLGNGSFYGCTALTGIELPDSLTEIVSFAFYGCTALTGIELPDGLTAIGDSVFSGCTSLQAIAIPGSVTSLGTYAFNGCTGMTSVTLGNGVKTIGNGAFRSCEALTSVTIPDSVTTIGEGLFSRCYGLTAATIGCGVTEIKPYLFSGCSKLKKVYYTGTEAQWNEIPIGENNSILLNADRYYRPTVPQNVTAQATGEKEITVSWAAMNGVTQFNVYRYNGTAYKYLGTTYASAANPTRYADSGLTVGTDYYYKVVAVYKGNGLTLQSDKSTFAHTVALGTPAVPQNVAVKPTAEKELTISWNAVKGATQYNVYRYNGTAYKYVGTTFATAAKPTQYVDSGLTVGTDYYYKVVAVVKGSGLTYQSDKSALAHTVALGTPGIPQNVAVKPTAERELTVTWSVVKGATQYNVYRYNGTAYKYVGTTFATAAKPTQYVDSGLTVGTDYYYKVIAVVKGSGLTYQSDKSAFAHTVALGTPAIPTNVAVKPTAEKELTVTWAVVKGATQYNVYRYNGTSYQYIGTTFAAAAKPTQYVDGGLTVGTDYYYKVVSVVKGSGLTYQSDKSAFAHTVALGTPGIPQNVAVKPTAEKELTVTWAVVKGATQYNVYRYNGTEYKYIGTTFATAAKPTQYVDGGLTVGTDYYYKVVAVGKGSGLTFVSDKSAFAHAVALGTPAVPANVKATASGARTITVSWSAVKGATQYNVYRYNGTTYKYIGTTSASASKPTQYADSGLTVGTDYYYKVVAVVKGSGLTFQSEKSAYAHVVAKA